MKHYALILVMALSYGEITADTVYHAFCTNAISTLAINGTSDVAFTNRVATFIAETNGAARATARVVMAVALYDIFDQTADEAALNLCMLTCTNVIVDTDFPTDSWQKAAAVAVLATALSTRCRYGESFIICTNALARNLTAPSLSDDIMLWEELCTHQFVPGMDVQATLKFYSAMSLIFDGVTSNLSTYTNALPSVANGKILEALK